MYLFDEETKEFLKKLNVNQVDYLVVGGFAVNYHGYLRATGDLDIWWNPEASNFNKLISAIEEFGFDCSDIKLLKKYDRVKSMIRLPLRDNFDIELLSLIDGRIPFDEAYKVADVINIADIPVKIINYVHLIQNKLGSHRPKDLHDIAELDKIKQIVKGKKPE